MNQRNYWIGIFVLLALLSWACGSDQGANESGASGEPEPGVTLTPADGPFTTHFRRQAFRQTYTGHIAGDAPVELTISIRKGDVKGSMTFKNTGKTTFADGKLSEEGSLRVKIKDGPTDKGLINAWFLDHGYISGTWVDLASGEELPLLLTDGTASIEPNAADQGVAPGELYEMRHDVFCESCECLLKFYYPQILPGPGQNQAAVEAINEDLRQQRQLLDNLKCARISRWEYPTGVSNSQTRLFNQDWLSVRFYGMGQDAQGDSLLVFDALTYSLKSGKKVELEDLLSDVPGVLKTADAQLPPGAPLLSEGMPGESFDFFLNEKGLVFFYCRPDGRAVKETEIPLSWEELEGKLREGLTLP